MPDQRDGAQVDPAEGTSLSWQENERVTTGAVGLNPEGPAFLRLIRRHDHAALGEATLVLISILRMDFAPVTLLVPMKAVLHEFGSQDGFRARGNQDFAQRENLSIFHGQGFLSSRMAGARW